MLIGGPAGQRAMRDLPPLRDTAFFEPGIELGKVRKAGHRLPQPATLIRRLNDTPRKCLDFRTPAEAFSTLQSSVALQT